MVGSNFHRHILYSMDFEETIEKFQQMIKQDKSILITIDVNQKKKGIFSPAIRYLIKQYVDKNWEAFRLKHIKNKEVVENA